MFFVFNFLLIFCSSIRVIVDKTNFNSLVDISFKLPVFIVFYSPYCIHCQKMHPDWLEFMEKYKDDPYIVAAEINCYEFRKEAGTIMSISGYPTYALVRDGRGTSVSVTRTTKAFSAKAEEIKAKYPPKSNINFKCHYFTSNTENIKYPIMTLLASYTLGKSDKNSNNIIKGVESVCNLLEKISELTKISLDNLLINQTSINLNSSEYLTQSNSIVIAKTYLNQTKTIEYKLDFNSSNNQKNTIVLNNQVKLSNTAKLVSEDILYDVNSLTHFAQEYLSYKQFGDWDIINDNNAIEFAFIKSNRRLLLFVFDNSNNEIQTDNDDDSLSNQILIKYKGIATNYAEHFLVNKISSTQLQKKWNIAINNDSNSTSKIHIIVSNVNKSHFALLKNIESANIKEVIEDVKNGFYDTKDDKELQPLTKIREGINGGSNNNRFINQRKKKKSPFAFFAIGYFVFALIITFGIIYFLLRDQESLSTDSRHLIEKSENESENANPDDYTSVLNIEPEDNEQSSTNDKA